jgi:hypothetical protein
MSYVGNITAIPGTGLITSFNDVIKYFDPRIHVLLYDDFVSGSQGSTLGWNSNGGGTLRTNQAQSSTNTGYFRLETQGVEALGLYLQQYGGYGGYVVGGGQTYLHYIAKMETLSNSTDRFVAQIGMISGTSTSFSDGFWFNYSDNLNSGNWQLIANSGAGTTTVNTSTPADTNWHVFAIKINSAGTLLTFYIDGTSVGTINVDITTDGIGPAICNNKTVNGTGFAFFIDLDQFYFFQELAVAR